jgi:response regulator RpfG family c-di-GMP phosphodiesterase
MTKCPHATAGHFSVSTPRVLVVENYETIREMAREVLTDVGYHTIVTETGWRRCSTGSARTWWCSTISTSTRAHPA